MGIFEDMLAESMGDFKHNPEKVVNAKVVFVDRYKVVVDVGLHTEGYIPRSEFAAIPEVGEEVSVVVEALDDGSGQLKIVHREVMHREQSEKIPQMVDGGEIVAAKVTGVANAGLDVQIGYLTGFIPKKLVDVVPVANFEQFVGQELRAKVLSYDPTHDNLVLSRKAAIIDERGGKIPALDRELEVGDIIEGKIINIQPFGLFVDVGGVSPLLHRSDFNWDGSKCDLAGFNIGDRLTVVVKRKDAATSRYFLSLKHLDMTPWEDAKQAATSGEIRKAKVVKVKENGDLAITVNGVAGVVKFSDVSWTRMTASSANVEFRRDSEIDVKITGFNDEFGAEEIIASRKACMDNPWEEIQNTIKEGDVIEASIKSIAEKMLFVNIHKDIDALVPVREVSWVNQSEEFAKLNVGDKVKVMITSIDSEDRRVGASMKAAQKSPTQTLKKGVKVLAKVTSIAKNSDVMVGCEVEGETKVGVILARNALPSKSYRADEIYSVGQALDCEVLNVLQNGVINLISCFDWEPVPQMNSALSDALKKAKGA